MRGTFNILQQNILNKEHSKGLFVFRMVILFFQDDAYSQIGKHTFVKKQIKIVFMSVKVNSA